jgi:hypothetical protein
MAFFTEIITTVQTWLATLNFADGIQAFIDGIFNAFKGLA